MKFLNYLIFIKTKIILYIICIYMGIGDWGLGIGDWGLGIGPNPQSPIPNPPSPIPNPQIQIIYNIIFVLIKIK